MKRFLAILLVIAMLPIPATFAREADRSAVIPEEAYDAVTADVWEKIETLEAEQVVAKRGRNADASDYAAIVDDVIAAVEASDTFVEGSIHRNGAFFTWRTTEGIACGYSPRLRAQARKTAVEGADPEALAGAETTSYTVKGGSPSSTSVAVFQPYYGLDSSFQTTYANEGVSIAQAMGGTSTTYRTTSATVDAIADAFESCAVVIFDSHGDTDYYNPSNEDDFVSRANTSYICLQSGTGLTTADMADVTGTYGTYQHAYYAGADGSMKYYCVDGTAIANHMEKTAPHNMLWSAICLGMATDGLHAPLRAKGVEVAYGYSQSVSFICDYAWEDVFWDSMIAGGTVSSAVADMKNKYGEWDYCQKMYNQGVFSNSSWVSSTISSARSSYCAFPIVVSSEDTYPGKGNVDSLQTVNSTWKLRGSSAPTEPTTAPTEPTTAPTQPTTAPTTAPTEPVGGEGFMLADSVKTGDRIVLVAAYNGKNYAMTNDTSISNALGAEEVTVNGNTVDVSLSRSAGSEAVWTLAAGSAAGTYLLKSSDGKYINWTSGTTLKLNDSGVNFTITCGEGTSSVLVTDTIGQATVRGLILRDNNGPQFRAYSTNNITQSGYSGTLTIYKRASSVTPTEPTTAPTEPTTAPTQPTTAPTEPVGGDGDFVLSSSIKNGDQVVIYNPGHGMAIKDENDNHWYLVPQAITPANNKIANPDASLVWTVVDNGNGTYSFTNGSDKIVCWVSGNYFELTNDASHSGANGNWVVTWAADGLAYIKHESFSNNYGPAYIECYYNANKDVTNISGYSTSDPTTKSNDFGFQFYVKNGSVTPTTAPTEPTTAPTQPTTTPTEPTTAPTQPTEPISGGAFVKVAAEQTDWSGKYLIAYESGDGTAIVYCGSDAAGDTISAAISSSEIAYVNGMAIVTVKKCGSGYSMQLADGTYLDSKPLDGNGNEQNGIVLSENEAELTLGYSGSSTDVVSATGSVLRYNAADGQGRFRFYKSATYINQKPIQLYKLNGDIPQPTEPTTAPTEPTAAPTEPTEIPPVSDVPINEGDCVVIYNAASGVIIGYNEDTDYDESTGDYTYINITTESADVSGTTLKALFDNAGTFYVIANADGTYAFLDQYDYDQSEDPENPTVYFITAAAPDTYYDNTADYAAFELIPTDGGYLLRNVADDSYYAIENGVVAAKQLVAGDPSFVFKFAIWDGTMDGEDTIVCTLLGTTTPATEPTTAPTQPTVAPTQPTTAPTQPTVAPTQPTTAPTEPVGDGSFVLSSSIKGGDQVVIYNPGHGMAIKDENDNNWYLVPQAITPSNNKIYDPDASLIWTVVDNGNGTYSFVNGSDKIVMWVSGNYFELTNDASYSGADGNWKVSFTDGLAYIQHATFSNSYGPAYIECYYNANKDKTNISGYSTSDPTTKSNDFGFQFFVKTGSTTPTEPTTAPTQPTVAPTEPTTAPTQPTTAPTQPTTQPTTAPTQPTTAPTEPTTAPSEYKVKVKADNDEHGRVTIVDNVVAATPDNGYYASGFILEPADAATVLQSGNFFYLSNITKDCCLTVQFREKDHAELRFSVPAGCSAKRVATWIDEPTALKAPEGEIRADMHEYIFLGWTETRVKDDKEKPVYFTNSYTPQAALTTLYALYTYDYRGDTYYTTVLQMKTCLAKKFNDVDVKAWYHEALDFVLEYQYMNGVADFKFDPNGKLTRGMMVTILYRLEEREGRYSHPFTDVEKGAWYAKAVAWAYESGIVNGMSATKFCPNEPITREQTAAMLYRYAMWNGDDVTPKGSLMNFVDANKVSAFARDPMRWAVGEGIINGKGKIDSKPANTDKNEPTDILDPLGTATRAEIAQILYGWLS